MRFLQKDVVIGRFLSRYKRFLLDFEIKKEFKDFKKGEVHTAHLANTGSMKSCYGEDWDVFMTHSDDPKRKLKFSVHMLHNGESWIMVNTGLTNKLVSEGLEEKSFKELSKYPHFKSEVKVGKSRIDFVLSSNEIDKKNLDDNNDLHFVEVKNVSLKEGTKATFPDAVSERGQKHLQELMDLVDQGHKASMLYIVSREDVKSFGASDIDPKYKELLKQAKDKGVNIMAYQLNMDTNEIKIGKKLRVNL